MNEDHVAEGWGSWDLDPWFHPQDGVVVAAAKAVRDEFQTRDDLWLV